MKVKITYDDGFEEEIEPKKVEIIEGKDDKNIAHYKFTSNGEKIIIIHIYVPTKEKATVFPQQLKEKVKNSVPKTDKNYLNQADSLIRRAESMSNISAFMTPSKPKCFYCGDIAVNEHQGKHVCSSCFTMLMKYNPESKEFQNYLKNKVKDKWMNT
ncbi:hypothetical protein [Acidianus manzaensis]|uniref:Uncharacterized protein n=1 Tax=Acidianus manzaensis TaxID=282676 RepID=A0A1W6JWI8_9CREN|nr:hypothetical protein [Acidianus manzaensis]ARM74628.1 hypothetical protein B6F84_00370 [Acidianus manzaensis]